MVLQLVQVYRAIFNKKYSRTYVTRLNQIQEVYHNEISYTLVYDRKLQGKTNLYKMHFSVRLTEKRSIIKSKYKVFQNTIIRLISIFLLCFLNIKKEIFKVY